MLFRSGKVVLYGITPPKATNSQDEITQIAKKQIERLSGLDIDGLVVYDIQEEADRTDMPRPFPYLETIDPRVYANKYLNELNLPNIIYKAVAKSSKDELRGWLDENRQNALSVFVGASSKTQSVKCSISEAYEIARDYQDMFILGGIAISERHMTKKDEHKRVVGKIESGCRFFITQAVYDLDASKKFLDDYYAYSKSQNIPFVPIIFTLTPCGSKKSLEFMKWLGIYISPKVEQKLLNSDNMLKESLEFIEGVFEQLYMYGLKLGIPIGCNVESVAIRKEEIEASISLVKDVRAVLNNA